MNKKKLWIFTELFYPEETSTSYILTKIANKLVEKYNIEVVCGEPVYDLNNSKTPNMELHKEILVDRIKGFKVNKNNLISRVLRFAHLSINMTLRLIFKVKKDDKVFIVTNPAPLILFSSLIKKFKKYELIILVHDVFPENTIPSGVISSSNTFLYKFSKALFDRAYSASDLLIVLGRDMEEIIKNKVIRFNSSPNIKIIENWGDTRNINPVNSKEIDTVSGDSEEKIEFLYAGNLGRLQGFMQFLEILNEVDNSIVHFKFRGEGALKEEMNEFVKENNLKNISFGHSYRRDEQEEILNKCDIAVILLAEGMKGLGVPSKAYNILAAGKPIFFIGDKDSEISLEISEKGIGVSFEFSQKEEIISYLNGLDLKVREDYNEMGKVARFVVEGNYTEEIILEKFYNLI